MGTGILLLKGGSDPVGKCWVSLRDAIFTSNDDIRKETASAPVDVSIVAARDDGLCFQGMRHGHPKTGRQSGRLRFE